MTRLIDGDALKAWFEEFRPLSVDRMLERIDAAPTIEPGRCGECAHYEAYKPSSDGNPYKWGDCTQLVSVGDGVVRADFGCVLFAVRDRKESDE